MRASYPIPVLPVVAWLLPAMSIGLATGCLDEQLAHPGLDIVPSPSALEQPESGRLEAYPSWLAIHRDLYSRKDFPTAFKKWRKYLGKYPPQAFHGDEYVAIAELACAMGQVDYAVHMVILCLEAVLGDRGQKLRRSRSAAAPRQAPLAA